MKKVIWKYQIDPAGTTQHKIPDGSVFLDLQLQGTLPVMWWLVPEGEYQTCPINFFVYGTGIAGDDINDKHYVGTFQVGSFVGHVFADTEIPATQSQ